jgi:hypothetical protein
MTQPDPMESLLSQAENALALGDRRTSAILVDQALKRDFTNQRAWLLLRRLMGSDKTLQDFQLEFTAAHFPDKLPLLPASEPAWLNASASQTLSASLSNIPPQQQKNFNSATPFPTQAQAKKKNHWGCVGAALAALALLVLAAAVAYYVYHSTTTIDWCKQLDCSQVKIRSVEKCRIPPVSGSSDVEALYILQVDLVTPSGGKGRSESMIASKHLNGWLFSEDYWQPSLTCADYLP